MAVAGFPPCCLLQVQGAPPVLALSQHILKEVEAVLCLGPVTHEEKARVMEMLTLMGGQAYHILEEKQRTEQFHAGYYGRIFSLALT